ncbi:dynamin family protein [Acaryochloris sp. CCMEE 5410]|uniref:dynamin family protein n=1 Tax=Acaryochloris sp. CCMEE 5410 TaxID=310037 RepID=UPI00024837AA|nr:dynamin family protein [Acaryochloris sp. CCMEE 5410]KAI9131210.1 dynamin family protein [Acaryochloris sp. CCMEE 5410]
MAQLDTYRNLLQTLQMTVGVLELRETDELRREVLTVVNRVQKTALRIAIFGPFNYGKSTLLNALLGEKALPIDLIPTTGAAITVRYGPQLQTRICLQSSQEIVELGTDILKQYAILDDNRRMREDVVSVEVSCPHPFLQTGVELLDLPGTNDREAQDALAKEQLLTADLVIQMLDGRKLMTLGEREHLRDWLLDRGIESVVFVVNFLNLLDPDDQKQVMNRMRFVAESFRSQLPPGISNLYRVDALPALRAQLKGDMATAQTTGLPMLETALQSIVQAYQTDGMPTQSKRAIALAKQLQLALQEKIAFVQSQVQTDVQDRAQQRLEIKQRAQKLIIKGFRESVADTKVWLDLPTLLRNHETGAQIALQQERFPAWLTETLKPTWLKHQREVVGWVHKACAFFNQPRPAELWFAFPSGPAPQSQPQPSTSSTQSKEDEIAPVAIATGLGWLMGGPLGAAIFGGTGYVVNKLENIAVSKADLPKFEKNDESYQQAARYYLTQFRAAALTALQEYERTAEKIILTPVVEANAEPKSYQNQHQLTLLQNTLTSLEEAIEAI